MHGVAGFPAIAAQPPGALPLRRAHHWRRGVLGAVAPVLGSLCRALATVRDGGGGGGGGRSARRCLSIAAVVADLWARLASFVSLGIAPRDWQSVLPGHPFLCCVSDRVMLNGPPDVASRPGSPVS